MNSMLDKLQNDLRQAQLAKNEVKVSTLRLLLSEIHNAEISQGGELSDEDAVGIIQREVKKRKEAAEGFRSGGREEAASKEEAELKVLQDYLPAQMSNEELTEIIEQTITELEAKGPSDMGKVIGAVMGKVKGKTDGGTVSALVKEKLL